MASMWQRCPQPPDVCAWCLPLERSQPCNPATLPCNPCVGHLHWVGQSHPVEALHRHRLCGKADHHGPRLPPPARHDVPIFAPGAHLAWTLQQHLQQPVCICWTIHQDNPDQALMAGVDGLAELVQQQLDMARKLRRVSARRLMMSFYPLLHALIATTVAMVRSAILSVSYCITYLPTTH